jgi:hypothetical protein
MESQIPDSQTEDSFHHLGEGTYVVGNVNTGGDFVGRDQPIYGDLVRGDKIINQTLSEAAIRDQNNRHTLRLRVKKYWIEGVFEHSLNHEAAIRLHLTDRSHLIENRPWQLIPQQSDATAALIPPTIPILEVFDQMNQRLLILGEPGAGKTTLLLELACGLLKRADETPTYPSPVVFNLSSWIQRKPPLAKWLVDELRTRYTIPPKIAQAWVAQDKILPLLDGLDEVQPEHRVACAQAINQFQQEHLVPLVVCSRVAEYKNLTVQLKLEGAVLLQPLTTAQIEAYLERADPSLAAVRTALQHDTELQALAQSPLILSIMALAYQNVTLAELSLNDATPTRRPHLLNAYIQRMFERRELAPIYSSGQTLRWLQWLATRLLQQGQTIFLIERMQPSWLQATGPKPSRMSLLMLLVGPIYGLIGGLMGGLIVGLFYGLRLGLNGGLRVGLRDGLLFGLRNGLSFGLIVGLSVVLIDGLSGRFRKINPIAHSSVLRRKLTSSLYATLFWGLFVGLSVGLLVGLSGGLRIGLSVGLSGGLLYGLSGGLIGGFREIELVRQPGWSWPRIKSNLYFGLSVGLSGGLILGLILGLSGELLVGLFYGLSVGLLGGLSGGLLGALIFQPSTGTDIPLPVETQTPNQGIRSSARYSLITSLIFGLSVGLIVGLSVGLLVGLSGGLIYGLSGGLSVGLLFGLIGGGDVVMKHYILRLVLWWHGYLPWSYARFLDYTAELIFLRKVGGGYIFVHRLVLEHFAALDEKEIERITASSNFR